MFGAEWPERVVHPGCAAMGLCPVDVVGAREDVGHADDQEERINGLDPAIFEVIYRE
jgi:hypothetical protein